MWTGIRCTHRKLVKWELRELLDQLLIILKARESNGMVKLRAVKKITSF